MFNCKKDGGKLAKLYQPYKYETFERTGDLYSLFYERGTSLLNENGILCYITSNKSMRANYGASTRQFFSEKTYPLLLIDFGNIQVFDTATVDTNILILQNKPKARIYDNKETFAVRINNDFNLYEHSLQEYILKNRYILPTLSQNSWVVGERDIYNIKEIIEQQGVPLWKWVTINYGLKTGLNDAFIINSDLKNKLIEEDEKSRELLKPILRGKDISAWYPKFAELWLVNSHNGIKSKDIQRINVKKDYPSIYNWFLNFKVKMSKRSDQGDDWTNLRNCAYLLDFEKPKIIFVELSKYLPFIYDKYGEFYADKTCFIITGKHLQYLTCFLNSKLYKFCFSDNFSELQGGTRVQSKIFFEQIPVKKITDKIELPFAKILDYLVAFKKEGSTEPSDQLVFIYFEQIANALIYELYFKAEFVKLDFEVAKYVNDLPELDSNNNESIILQLRRAYIKAHEQNSPIRNAVENMTSIPQINLINNSVTI